MLKAAVDKQPVQVQHFHRADQQSAEDSHTGRDKNRTAKIIRVARSRVVVELAQQAALQQRIDHTEQQPDEPERSDAREITFGLPGEHRGKIRQRPKA